MAATVSPAEPKPRSAYGPAGRSPWLDVDWRKHQHWTIVNDTPVNVVELGEGPPLVFVHGLSGSWPNWLEQVPVFGASHRVIALDLPGFGRSPMPPDGTVSITWYADLLDALLERLGVERAMVVGNSMGGFIACELAVRHPDRVERLALVSPAGLSTYRDPRLVRYLPWVRRAERPANAFGTWLSTHADAATSRPGLRNASFGMIAPHAACLPAPLVAEQLRGAGKPGLVPAAQAISDRDLRPQLRRIACPTLIVWGRRDRVITRRDLDAFAELIPDSRKVLYEDTGHVAQMERPAEFNALLAEFLSE